LSHPSIRSFIHRILPSIDQYKRKISAAGYESKVPEAVRITNAEKLASLEAELEATIAAISAFELMR
jgi:isopentenyl diphosphate isomerase/L-lactate dehydrogenase-like FMN-dependent dehydrogenase